MTLSTPRCPIESMTEESIKQKMEWVVRNRTKRNRTVAAGAAVSEFARRLWTLDIGPTEAAAEALVELTDDEFQRHCRVASLDGSVITIRVDEPSMVAIMRMKWADRLKRELPSRLSRGISKVVFAAAVGGVKTRVDEAVNRAMDIPRAK